MSQLYTGIAHLCASAPITLLSSAATDVHLRATQVHYLRTDPKATLEAMASPRAADLPRPLAAVKATVLRRVFSEIASTNFSTAFACTEHAPHVMVNVSSLGSAVGELGDCTKCATPTWSMVLQHSTTQPTGCVSASVCFSALSSCSLGDSSWKRRNHNLSLPHSRSTTYGCPDCGGLHAECVRGDWQDV